MTTNPSNIDIHDIQSRACWLCAHGGERVERCEVFGCDLPSNTTPTTRESDTSHLFLMRFIANHCEYFERMKP